MIQIQERFDLSDDTVLFRCGFCGKETEVSKHALQKFFDREAQEQ